MRINIFECKFANWIWEIPTEIMFLQIINISKFLACALDTNFYTCDKPYGSLKMSFLLHASHRYLRRKHSVIRWGSVYIFFLSSPTLSSTWPPDDKNLVFAKNSTRTSLWTRHFIGRHSIKKVKERKKIIALTWK